MNSTLSLFTMRESKGKGRGLRVASVHVTEIKTLAETVPESHAAHLQCYWEKKTAL